MLASVFEHIRFFLQRLKIDIAISLLPMTNEFSTSTLWWIAARLRYILVLLLKVITGCTSVSQINHILLPVG